MEHLDKESFLVSRGFTYAYYHRTATSNQPTALLIHGFPDTADVWTDVITNWLQPNGYGLVAIDCLGYGGTSKPCELTAYKVDAMTQDIMEILDNESLDKVVVIGHDWVAISHIACIAFIPIESQAWFSSTVLIFHHSHNHSVWTQ